MAIVGLSEGLLLVYQVSLAQHHLVNELLNILSEFRLLVRDHFLQNSPVPQTTALENSYPVSS